MSLRSTGGYFSYWHDPSVPATVRVGPEVGVELPMVALGALTFRNGRETVRRRSANRLAKMTLSGPRSPYLILTWPTVPLLTASSSIVVLMLTPLALRVISRIRRLNRSGAFGAIVRLTLSME